MDDRILVLAPWGRDGQIAVDLLHRAGFEAVSCGHLADLARALPEGAGVALVAEEALADEDLHLVTRWLDQQPPWSDVPFVILANGH